MDEFARHAALTRLDLSKATNPAFYRITELASLMFGCPMSTISVVERDRVWHLAETGLHTSEISLRASFCSASLAQSGPLLVHDARADERFASNELVAGPPYVRSYLGIPIKLDASLYVGALNVMSPEPGAFSERDVPALASFALLVEQGMLAHSTAVQLTRAITSLRELNQLFKQAEEAAQIGSWKIDLDTDALQWSQQVYAIHGLEPDTPIDKPFALQCYIPEDRELVTRAMREARVKGARFNFEANIQRPDGEIRRVRALGERVDVGGRPKSLAGIFLDCTDDYLKTVALQRAAERDRLTGLYNRAAFDARLASALDGEAQGSVTLLLLDLDGFKDVNDTFGHLVGDRLLVALSDHLRTEAGDRVFVARWGGDEFAFLFPAETTLADATLLGERLVRSIGDQSWLGTKVTSVSATCGIAQMQSPGSAEELVRRADLALYHGKESARGAVHCWTEEIEGTLALRQKALMQVRNALGEGQALAMYQPIVDLQGGQVVGFEALFRVQDRQGRIFPAASFLPALVDPDISRKVSRFMVEQVAKDGPELVAAFGEHCRIAINTSQADLRGQTGQNDFITMVRDVFGSSALLARNITFEVTETMLLQDENGRVREVLNDLEQLGFSIVLDDFGTGFSSLTHLRDFPISGVKIDKEFVDAISTDHQSRLIIQAIVQLGRSLGLYVVAEGVETEAQETFLRASKCEMAQGYRFGRPMKMAALLDNAALRARVSATPPPARACR